MPTPDDYANNQPGANWRNFTPPPTTPGVFNPADPYGRRPDPSRTTESATRNGNGSPQATQVAAAPPPPGVPVGTTYPPPPNENIAQPTPGAYQPRGPVSPVPWHQQQPPPAEPTPPLADWKHDDQVPDWLAPHIRPAVLRGPLPNRPPDQYWRGSPVWNTRPGEVGYGAGGSSNILSGIVAKLESGSGLYADMQPASMVNKTYGQYRGFVASYGEGPAGITNYARQMLKANPNATLGDFEAGYVMGTGNPAHPPSLDFMRSQYPAAYNNLVKNAGYPLDTPLSSLVGGAVAGPPQQYIPPQGREPHQWGETPTHEWGEPGRMPQAHDIPGIMGGLLPIALTLFAGLAGGGALGAIAAFSGYQNARNKGQTTAAKDAKETFQNKLKETESGLKEELLEAAGIWAQYGNDQNSPGARSAWWELSSKYQDKQLLAALESGNTGAIEQLFKKRDEAFQTIGKVSAATTKADEQAEAAAKARADEGAMGFPETPSGAGAPAGPEKPWENAPAPTGPEGGPPAAAPPAAAPGSAGVPQGGASAPAAPAPSQQPSEQAPSEEPEPAPPGTPSATLPPVDVNAPVPAPSLTAGAPRTPFDAMVSDIVNGEEIEKLKPAISADGLKKLQAAVADKENHIEAVKPGPQAAAELKAIDPTFGYYAEGVSNYTMPDPTARSQNRGYIARLFAAAQKINKEWDYKDYATKQEFRTAFGPDKDAGKTLSRTARLYNLSKELADDAVHLPNTNVARVNQLIAWFQSGQVGDPRYTKFISDWRLFANDAQAVASGRGVPPVTLTSHLIDTLQLGATPQMIRQGLKEDLLAALSSVDPLVSGWHRQFPGQANPPMFDQGTYAELNRYAHMNIDTGDVPEALPDVGYSQEWGGQTHYYLGGDITNRLNWSTQKPPEAR